ncbi:DnaJ domain-containing protein, partial [Calycina marina]
MAQAVGIPDYYATLQVSRYSSTEAIRDSYRKQALKEHPDKSKYAGATERFQRLAEAWEILRDHERRAAYDRELE